VVFLMALGGVGLTDSANVGLELEGSPGNCQFEFESIRGRPLGGAGSFGAGIEALRRVLLDNTGLAVSGFGLTFRGVEILLCFLVEEGNSGSSLPSSVRSIKDWPFCTGLTDFGGLTGSSSEPVKSIGSGILGSLKASGTSKIIKLQDDKHLCLRSLSTT